MDARRARIWLVICVLAVSLISGCSSPVSEPTPVPEAEVKDRCPLDGTVLLRTAEVTKRTLAVIIDNDPAAWPVSGLSRACLVYELPVEGSLTRFIAFYHHQDAALTGPVRSARSYFLPLLQENDAILAHVGGSEAALTAINTSGLDHLDELVGGTPFWQGASRERPYSTFTNTDQLRTAAVKAGLRGTGSEQPFASFSEDKSFVSDPVTRAAAKPAPTISFGSGAKAINYRYDQVDGTYHRYAGDSDQRDGATAGGISPKTVVVLFLANKPAANGPEGSLRLTGQGTALFFSGGVGTAGTWRKSAAAVRTKLLDAAGAPVVLPPGQVLVHIVYAGSSVVPDPAAK